MNLVAFFLQLPFPLCSCAASGKVILMASNTDLEANFCKLLFCFWFSILCFQLLCIMTQLPVSYNVINPNENSFTSIIEVTWAKRRSALRGWAGFKAFIVHDDVHRDILVPGRVMFSEANNSKIKIDHTAFVSKANGETLSKYVGVGHINASVLLVPRLNKPEWWIFIVSFLIGVGAALAACIFLLRQASRNL